MGALLYSYNNGKTPVYSNDNLAVGITYEYIMDVCVANAYHKKFGVTAGLKKAYNEILEMLLENTNEDFKLALPAMEKQIKNERS